MKTVPPMPRSLVRRPIFAAMLAPILAVTVAAAAPPARAHEKSAQESPAAQASAPEPVLIEQIAAVVNSDVITRNELRDRTQSVSATLQSQGTALPPRDLLEKQVLERMIIERIQLQDALDLGMQIDDSQLDRAMGRIAEQNKLTLQQFRDRVEHEGTPFAKFREEVRNQIIINRLRDKEVDSRLQITEGEIDSYLAEQAGLTPGRSEVDVAQILLRLPEQASAEQIEAQRKRADQLYQQLEGGADFAKLAASYSDAPEGLKGGELGWRAPERLPQLFAETVAPLAPGQVAKPVKSPNGFHILKLVGRRALGNDKSAFAPVAQTHARHILIKVNEAVSSQQAKQRITDLKQRLDNKSATFEDLAKSYSNDASAGRGGDLGTLYPGDTVPEFEQVMNALQPGEISEPVQTQFGWHLIQVIDRKTEDLSPDRKRQIARQTLRERRSDEAYTDFVRQLRDKAYVEYRLDDTRS